MQHILLPEMKYKTLVVSIGQNTGNVTVLQMGHMFSFYCYSAIKKIFIPTLKLRAVLPQQSLS